jgi:hypothetical protein
MVSVDIEQTLINLQSFLLEANEQIELMASELRATDPLATEVVEKLDKLKRRYECLLLARDNLLAERTVYIEAFLFLYDVF